MESFIAGSVMFVVGAVLAVVINLYLLPELKDARARSSESTQVMGWIVRFILLFLPIVFAIIGAGTGSRILGSAAQ